MDDFLINGNIICGLALAVRITKIDFSVSVKLCGACASSCLRGCQQAGKAGQLIR